MKKVLICLIGFVCIALSGCFLKDIEERGDPCPPVLKDDVRQLPYVPILDIRCFAEDIVIPAEIADNSIRGCEYCTTDDEGAYVCGNEAGEECMLNDSSIKHVYTLCEYYRNNGVLSRTGSGAIAFVRDHFGHDVDQNVLSGFELKDYCPPNYSQCYYYDLYRDEDKKILGGYGCMARCEEPMIYCTINDNLVCVDPDTDDRVCGAKGGCFDSNVKSANWFGEHCEYGATCKSGECRCESGLTKCSEDDGVRCVDTTNNENYCGAECKRCEDNEICENNVCKEDICQDLDRPVCSKNNCENSNEQCGKSCSNCTAMTGKLGVESAVCNNDIGKCEIQSCLSGYDLVITGEETVCTKSYNAECSTEDMTYCHVMYPDAEVKCNDTGQCEFIKCQDGFVDQGGGTCMNQTEKKCEDGGTFCPGDATCVGGECQCPGGQDLCGGTTCVSLNTNDRCGSCSNNCNAKEKSEGVDNYSCKDGTCVVNCIGGYQPDSTGCVPELPKKCEEGGTECPGNQECNKKQCGCPSGQMACDGTTCISLDSKDHCGSCDKHCSGEKFCSNGNCVCTTGYDDCGSGECIQLNTNTNCGACGNACGNGSCVCSGSSCSCVNSSVCDSDQQKCGEVCRNSTLPIMICNGKTDIKSANDNRLLESSPGYKTKYKVYGYHDSGKTKYRLLYNNEIAYISAAKTDTAPCVAEGVIKNTTRLKCRKDMTTNYAEIDAFDTSHPNICIHDLNPGNGWYGVFCGDKCYGYVMSEYVEIKNNNSFDVCE